MADGQGADWPEGFSIVREEDTQFDGGLRSFFQYKDLGIKDATGGKVVAHVIRGTGNEAITQWHHHDCDFQIVYILKGWIEFEYEGVGRVKLEPGTCVHQAPSIKHREIGHSADLELIEIVGPADFTTHADE